MESEKLTDPYKDNRNAQSRQSLWSTKNESQQSSFEQYKKNKDDKSQNEDEKNECAESRSKTRIRRPDPDQDQVSDGEAVRSSRSFYSEECESASPSEGSFSTYSRSRTPSPTPQTEMRAKRISSNSLYKTGGVLRQGRSCSERLGVQHLKQRRRRVIHSQNMDSTPPKDLDLVTKRMLSARLLKINELHNALAELQQRIDELQKENRILKQLQVRQEKALQRFDGTENEIVQLMARHNNDTHVLRERLRRSQERERAAEHQLKEREEQLLRSQATSERLKKLVDKRELGARNELSRKLEEEKARSQQAEGKIKDLERSMELSTSSYKRQLAAERKKTLNAQEEIRTLQEELERLTNKLKEKERELHTMNIYANRMMKPSFRNDIDNGSKRKVPSRTNTKTTQTKGRVSSLDFPTPPPDIINANEHSEHAADEYLSLKENVGQLPKADEKLLKEPHQKMRDQEQAKEKREKQTEIWEPNFLEKKAQIPRDEEKVGKRTSLMSKQEENNRKQDHVEVRNRNQDVIVNQQTTDEARHKKDQLLAKMHEIDEQNRRAQDTVFSPYEFNKGTSNSSSPYPSEQRKHSSSIFNLTASETYDGLDDAPGSKDGSRSDTESGALPARVGRRTLRSLTSSDDLAFGSYAPSFGNITSQGFLGFPPPPPREERYSALEGIGVFRPKEAETDKQKEKDRGMGKDKKSRLMQELFGAKPSSGNVGTFNKMDILDNSPATNNVCSGREGLLTFNSGSSNHQTSSLNTLHVADSRPAVCAITSFDDDIEELAL
ncbi:lebercilin isoform X2 [Antennarius striatus]|uniref:lebercilin isoform X2 n=1 Tax=Antennarius striatus TaxID=241820 RepID=UPI0035B35EAA